MCNFIITIFVAIGLYLMLRDQNREKQGKPAYRRIREDEYRGEEQYPCDPYLALWLMDAAFFDDDVDLF